MFFGEFCREAKSAAYVAPRRGAGPGAARPGGGVRGGRSPPRLRGEAAQDVRERGFCGHRGELRLYMRPESML